MIGKLWQTVRWLFDSACGPRDRLLPRWYFLRALGFIFYSAFFSLYFQIRGLIGPDGILPARDYLQAARVLEWHRFWLAPTLLWVSSGSHMLMAICWAGMIASILLLLNYWPRGMIAVCFVCYLSFVVAAQDFAGYQSDGMLLEAGFLSWFLAPPGLRPRLGADHPPSRASLWMLQWEWFRIYFESGMVKLASGDPQWRRLTAMDEYYQNGPLPTWIGWYAQHLPHWFQAGTAFVTLAVELALVWMIFLPRRFRIACFAIVTLLQIGIILTANYTFLNYLVLALGFLLLDDRIHWRLKIGDLRLRRRKGSSAVDAKVAPVIMASPSQLIPDSGGASFNSHITNYKFQIFATAFVLAWVFYAGFARLVWILVPHFPFPTTPVMAIEQFRVAEQYGLFAVMTRARWEIEFQGSNDGENWTSYPFRYKPQDLSAAPGIYAPYQPRFDWNLWFASLGGWRDNYFVVSTEERLLEGDRDVLALFAGNPFPTQAPQQVRTVIYRYWFTTMAEKRATGLWWHRKLLGAYSPGLERDLDGKIRVTGFPSLPETPE